MRAAGQSKRAARVSAAARGMGAAGFDAFISYSHKRDRPLAVALQRALQRFAKPWYRRRALRVFRDDANLGAEPELWPAIEAALAASQHMILLLSRDAAASGWVAREVEWWRAHKRPGTLLFAVTDEEVPVDGSRVGVAPAIADALAAEPRHVDLSWARGAGKLGLRHPAFREAVGELAAPLHGRPKDELVGEDIREHRRVVLLTRAAVVGLAALAAAASVAAVMAIDQRNTARNERARAVEQTNLATSRQLAAEASLRRRAEPELSLLLSVAALDIAPTPEARRALMAQASRWLEARRVFTARREQVQGSFPEVTALVWKDRDHVGTAGKGGLELHSLDGERSRTVEVPLLSAAYAPGGRWAAIGTVARGHALTLFDLRGKGRTLTLARRAQYAEQLAFGRGGKLLAAGTDRGTVLWRLTGRRPRIAGRLPAGTFTLSADGETLALVRGGRVELWDLRRLQRRASAPSPEDPYEIAISRHGVLAIGELDRVVLWDTRRRRRLAVLTGMSGPLAFSPDGHTLAASSHDTRVVLWDVEAGYRKQTLDGHSADVTAVAFAPDGRLVASADASGRAVVWRVDRRAGLYSGVPEALQMLDDGRIAIVEKYDNRLTLLDLVRRRTIATPVYTSGGEPDAVALRPDGRLLALELEGKVHVGDPQSKADFAVLPGSRGDVTALAFGGPRGERLGATYFNGRARLWDPHARRLLSAVRPSKIGLMALDFTADGRRVAFVGAAGHVSVWRVGDTLERQATLTGHAGIVYGATFSRSGRLLATGTDEGEVRLWDGDHARVQHVLRGHQGEVHALTFSADERLLATGGDELVLRLWDVEAGVSLGALPTPGYLYQLRFVPGARARLAYTTVGGFAEQIDVDPAALRSRLCALLDRDLTRREWQALMPDRQFEPTCRETGGKRRA